TPASQQAALEVRVAMPAQAEGGSQLPDAPLQVARMVSNLRLKVGDSGGGAGGYPAQQRAGQSNMAAEVVAALEGHLGELEVGTCLPVVVGDRFGKPESPGGE